MASIKKAASSEKMAIRDDMAYMGTLHVSALFNHCHSDVHDHDPNDSSLKCGFTIILQLKSHRHDRYRRSYYQHFPPISLN
jgi:hypothetical protein